MAPAFALAERGSEPLRQMPARICAVISLHAHNPAKFLLMIFDRRSIDIASILSVICAFQDRGGYARPPANSALPVEFYGSRRQPWPGNLALWDQEGVIMNASISNEEPVVMNFLEEPRPAPRMVTPSHSSSRRKCASCKSRVSRSAAYCSNCGHVQGLWGTPLRWSQIGLTLVGLAVAAAAAVLIFVAAVP